MQIIILEKIEVTISNFSRLLPFLSVILDRTPSNILALFLAKCLTFEDLAFCPIS